MYCIVNNVFLTAQKYVSHGIGRLSQQVSILLFLCQTLSNVQHLFQVLWFQADPIIYSE